MNTLSYETDTEPRVILDEAEQEAARDHVLRHFTELPSHPGALISRSLWVTFIGWAGIWNRATLPVDDRLDMPEPETDIAGLCDLVASLLRPPGCHEGERALVVLHRSGTPELSEADRYIYSMVRDAAVHCDTAPWAFYVTTPGGVRDVRNG
jgi:hypothetical protein